MGLLDGKVAVVTGAASGIGRAEALQLASEGAAVVVNDLAGGDDVVMEIVRSGGRAIASTADVADMHAGESLVRLAIASFGGLDILVNNAGVARDRMSFKMSEKEWDDVIRVHLKGTFVMSRFAGEWWRERAKQGEPVRASIINTSSRAGLYGTESQINYAAAKAGIIGMTLVLARELHRYGVHTNAIVPVALTPLTSGWFSGVDDRQREWLSPSQAAALVGWLASDLAAGVNGKVLSVRGRHLELLQGFRPEASAVSDEPWDIERVDRASHVLFAEAPRGMPPPVSGVDFDEDESST